MAGIPRRAVLQRSDRDRPWKAAQQAVPYPEGCQARSTAKALQVSLVPGQIRRTFPEFPNTPAGQIQSTRSPVQFLKYQTQSAPDQIRCRMTCGFSQLLENSSIFVAEAGVDITFHIAQCSTTHTLRATFRGRGSYGPDSPVPAWKTRRLHRSCRSKTKVKRNDYSAASTFRIYLQ